jgi:hypothetical protein
VKLPPNRYLPISSDPAAISTDAKDGALSAELICISGWHHPDITGIRPAQPTAILRFRVDAQGGTRINLVMRLAAHGRDFPILIRSGSGHETELSLQAGSEKVAVLSCEVEPGEIITAQLSTAHMDLDEKELSEPSYWMLKRILYFDPKRVTHRAITNRDGNREPSVPDLSLIRVEAHKSYGVHAAVRLTSAGMDDSRRASSFGAFLQTPNSFWPSTFESDRDAPIFADNADKQAFYSGCGKNDSGPQVGTIVDSIKLVRRSDQFVSMARFSEGSVFDTSGVWRGFGYLHGSPLGKAQWLSKDEDAVSVSEEALSNAPFYKGSYLVFYNGNLHNHYHWLVEGLLGLDVLSRAIGRDSKVKIALPKSMDINAVIDHRQSLPTLGIKGYDVVEVADSLMKVEESLWVESDLLQTMPAPYVKDFQQRISRMYAYLGGPRNRRILVARKGSTRTIHNLEQVQAFLSRYEFETVYLEKMSLLDQILLFQSAEFIISPHGAGLANLIFCHPGTRVIELMPSVELRPFFWLISDKLDLVYAMQFCPPIGAQEFQSSIEVATEKLHALIKMVDAHL